MKEELQGQHPGQTCRLQLECCTQTIPLGQHPVWGATDAANTQAHLLKTLWDFFFAYDFFFLNCVVLKTLTTSPAKVKRLDTAGPMVAYSCMVLITKYSLELFIFSRISSMEAHILRSLGGHFQGPGDTHFREIINIAEWKSDFIGLMFIIMVT